MSEREGRRGIENNIDHLVHEWFRTGRRRNHHDQSFCGVITFEPRCELLAQLRVTELREIIGTQLAEDESFLRVMFEERLDERVPIVISKRRDVRAQHRCWIEVDQT